MGKGKKNIPKGPAGKYDKKEVRQVVDAERSDHLTISWRLSRFDWDGPWGLPAFAGHSFDEIVRGWCCSFERQTWGEVFRAAGGRREGNNSHPVESENLTKQGRKRLEELKMEEYDTIYSFRVAATKRVYGIRDSRAFEVLWFDPWHGDNDKAVYPVRER